MAPLYSGLDRCLASRVGRQSLLRRSVTLANHGHEGQDQAAYSIPEGNQDDEDVGKKEVDQRDLGIGIHECAKYIRKLTLSVRIRLPRIPTGRRER